jgi:hypothetical protein
MRKLGRKIPEGSNTRGLLGKRNAPTDPRAPTEKKKKKKRVMPIISSSEILSRDKKNPDGPMKKTHYRYSADDGKAQSWTTRDGKAVKYDNAPFKTIDKRHYGLKKGGRAGYNIGGRANLLEEMGRIDARKHPDAADRAEKRRVIGELNKGYKSGGAVLKGKKVGCQIK